MLIKITVRYHSTSIRLKFKTLTSPNAGEHMVQQELLNGTATLEDSLAVSHKAKNTLIIQTSNHAPRYLPK